MMKLLRADFSRLFQNKVFLVSAAGMVLYGIAVCLVLFSDMRTSDISMSLEDIYEQGYGLMGMLPFQGIVLAAFCTLFVGTEFNDGTIRNKLVVGCSRTEIYLSGFITCAVAGVLLQLLGLAVLLGLGIPLFGFFSAPPSFLLTIFAVGLLMMISYAAVFYFVSMLVQNKAFSAVICLIGVMTMMVLLLFIILRLGESEYVLGIEMIDGKMVEKTFLNTRYLRGSAREILQFIADFFPTGQSLQISAMVSTNYLRMGLCSLGITAAAGGLGLLIFRRRDLK